jgi:ATP-binding cassette subfamily B protein
MTPNQLTNNENKTDVRIIHHLMTFLRPYKPLVAGAVVFGIVSMVMELAPPLLWKYGIDVGIIKQQWTTVPTVVLALVAIQALDAVTTVIRKRIIDRLTLNFGESLRQAVFRALVGLSHEQTTKQHSGELTHVYTSDIELLQKALIDGADTYIINVVRMVGIVCIFCWLQPALGAATLVPVVGVGILLFTYHGGIREFYRTARKSYGKLTRYVSDVIHGAEVVRAFGRQTHVIESHDRFDNKFMEIAVEAGERRAIFKPLVRGIAGFGNVIVYGFGAYLVLPVRSIGRPCLRWRSHTTGNARGNPRGRDS